MNSENPFGESINPSSLIVFVPHRTELVNANLVDGPGVQARITAEVFEEAPEAVNESLGSM